MEILNRFEEPMTKEKFQSFTEQSGIEGLAESGNGNVLTRNEFAIMFLEDADLVDFNWIRRAGEIFDSHDKDGDGKIDNSGLA